MTQNNQIQANANDVITNLSQQISNIIKENAVLNSLINQYQTKVNELEQQLKEQNNTNAE